MSHNPRRLYLYSHVNSRLPRPVHRRGLPGQSSRSRRQLQPNTSRLTEDTDLEDHGGHQQDEAVTRSKELTSCEGSVSPAVTSPLSRPPHWDSKDPTDDNLDEPLDLSNKRSPSVMGHIVSQTHRSPGNVSVLDNLFSVADDSSGSDDQSATLRERGQQLRRDNVSVLDFNNLVFVTDESSGSDDGSEPVQYRGRKTPDNGNYQYQSDEISQPAQHDSESDEDMSLTRRTLGQGEDRSQTGKSQGEDKPPSPVTSSPSQMFQAERQERRKVFGYDKKEYLRHLGLCTEEEANKIR